MKKIMKKIIPSKDMIQAMQHCERWKVLNTVREKMKNNQEDEAGMIRAHAAYQWPELFIWLYIRKFSYRVLTLKDFHIQILNAIKPGEYGKQINVQAPRGTGKTTLVNRLIPLWRICYKHFDLAMEGATRRIHPHCRPQRTHGAPTHHRNPTRP